MMPSLSLPEITFPAPAAVPPTVMPDTNDISIPACPLPRSIVPLASVPMKLPCTRVPVAPVLMIMPFDKFPEMMLRVDAVVPPMVLLGALRKIPLMFGLGTVPSVPI